MTHDPITLDLWQIHHDQIQLSQLHRMQQARLDEHQITGGNRPSGLRLSCADPVRRVKACFESWWRLTLDDGVAMRGHLLEDYLAVALFHSDYEPLAGADYDIQVPIQWHHNGVSAYDFVARGVSAGDLVISCKSSTSSATPTAANIAQERRMMAADGYGAGSPFQIWTVNPSTFRASGPYEYTLEQDHIDAWHTELAGVCKAYDHFCVLEDPVNDFAWNRPDQWLELFGLTSSSDAFRYTPKDASAAIEARVRAERRAVAEARAAKRDADAATERIYQFVDEQLALAREAGEDVKAITAYAADELVTYGRKSNGARHVTVKPLEAPGVADAA